MMDGKQIIMNFSVPPDAEDIAVMAAAVIDALPDELAEHCESLAVAVEEFPDELTEQEMDLADPYEMLALYKSGKEISPGVEKKTANDDDVLVLYRRPILDYWCESGDELSGLVRQVILEELGRNFEFSEDEIEEMNERHYQGIL